MLRKTSLVLVMMLTVATSVVAENKPGTFAAFDGFNRFFLRPAIVQGHMEGCLRLKDKDSSITEEYCRKEVSETADSIVAYATYRMVTERPIEDFGLMRDCFKNMESHKECPAIHAYVMQVLKDYDAVIDAQKLMIKNTQQKSAK